MNNSLFNFRDDEEREMFLVAIPVIALFALLGYWLMKGDAPEVGTQTVAAIAADTDGDGITDSTDQCINMSGTVANYGCPVKTAWAERDNDTDGIRNGIDSCPESKGVAEHNGCATKAEVVETKLAEAEPVVPSDKDGDGIIDEQDACANIAGDNGMGCPADADSDGVIDREDNCVDQPGPADMSGCPVNTDTDNDGVLNDADQCPDEVGSAATNGCPADTDGDGVYDIDDRCPTVAGNNSGCPADADGDGVADDADQCPQQAGLEVNNGCPADADSDGVIDTDDRCPQQAGVAANQGCPADTDADGIADADDQCPDQAGTAATNGCPATTSADEDTDGDGMPDTEDNCPTIKGVASNSGCPNDTDGDGIADADDKCPAVAGEISTLGCPEAAGIDQAEVKSVIDAAISGVKFNSSSAVLTARSREVLRKVAELMNKYPETLLEIRGHTDSSGNARKNMQLSMDRARSCAAFIAAQGINNDRLKAYGFGDTQPIADNATIMGRERNRRVQFELK